MEISRNLRLWFLLGIFLLACHAKADEYNYTYTPLKNVNLSPFWQWISAYQCLQNITGICLEKDVITLKGVVNVSGSELEQYCKPEGCGNHTKIVLRCVNWVKRDFRFANKITVRELGDLIDKGCSTNTSINTENYKSSNAMKKKTTQNLLVSLATGLLIAIMNM